MENEASIIFLGEVKEVFWYALSWQNFSHSYCVDLMEALAIMYDKLASFIENHDFCTQNQK